MYRSEYYSGKPAITLNRFGQGQAVYVGTLGDEALHDTLVGWALESAGAPSMLTAPSGVEVTARWQGDRRLLFLLNHTGETQEISIAKPHLDLPSGITVYGSVTMPPLGVFVLQEQG
jgi:beta-galactosidase